MAKVFIGTSGFYYKHWLEDFYPAGIKQPDLLSYYSQHFQTVEINSSFYHIPRTTTLEGWKAKVPDDFVFCFKASRIITHLKKFSVDELLIDKVFTPLKVVESNSCNHLVLFQTPANLKGNVEKLDHLLELLPDCFKYAFEFRDKTWFNNDVYDILHKHNAAVVLADSPVNRHNEYLWPYVDVDTADFAYIRFHGSKELYASSYSDEELKKYTELIKDKLEKEMDVFCYFNNDINGHALRNAKALTSFMK